MNNDNGDVRIEVNRKSSKRRKRQNVLKHSPIMKGDVIEEVQHSDGKVTNYLD